MLKLLSIKNLISFTVSFFILCGILFSGLSVSLAQNTFDENGNVIGNTSSPIEEDVTVNTGDGSQTTYELLQPLGSNGATTTSINIQSGGLSTYLQTIFQYVLVAVTVIAIFMLMYGGIEYLTTDIVNRKSVGKETILRALSGIIFIFCVWFILNIINPDLTNTALDLGVGVVDSATTAIGVGGVAGTPITGTPKPIAARSIAACPEGIVSVGSAQVCRTIAENVQKLLSDAASSGINISIQGSWRPPERQIALRKQNCGSTEYDIYTKPSGQCNPPTAIPGTSNHEKGLALDLGVGGASFCYNVPKTASAQNSCAAGNAGYQWMKANGSKYGLQNNIPLTKEAWHWSTTGN